MARARFEVNIANRTLAFEWDGETLYRDGRAVEGSIVEAGPGAWSLLLEGRSTPVLDHGLEGDRRHLQGRVGAVLAQTRDQRALLLESLGMQRTSENDDSVLRAPMPGLVLKVLVSPGDPVNKGDALVVLEAMKMENELRAERAGIVRVVHAQPGIPVGKRESLIEFETP